MHDAFVWVAFFGAPVLLLLVTAFVFRPSAREHYREAKQVIFADEGAGRPRHAPRSNPGRRSAS